MINNLSTVTNPYEIIEQLQDKIVKMEALLKYYEAQFFLAKRQQFGSSSERAIMGGQLSLLDDSRSADSQLEPPSEPKKEEITYKRKKQKGKREEDISNLPVVRVDYELPEDGRNCPDCGTLMKDIGVNVRRTVEIIPAQARLKEEAIHAYACTDDECAEKTGAVTIVKADAPKPLISGSLASPSFVAHIAMQKYANGMPLYRIEKGFEYDGVNISRQTMSNWVINCSENYLEGIYWLLIDFLLKETALHADETTVQVLHEPNRPAQSKSYEWVYRTSGCCKHKIVIYDYKETRKQEHPREFLRGFKGYLHTDGYQCYHNLPSDIIIVGCWAHARRYWEKVYKLLPKNPGSLHSRKGSDAEKGLEYIGALFDLERKFKGLPPKERYEKRLVQSKPVSDAFFAWVESLGALPKSLLGEAVHYALSQRKYLENVFLDGRLELSNNRCERSVKPFVMGRKAWLFSNTPAGAKASSVMYSIIETAKENGLHPFHYVKFLLEKLPNTTTGELEDLLPWSECLPECCRVPGKETRDS
jgi:transposase